MIRRGESFEDYQARLGTPVQAIEYALTIDDKWDMHQFLEGWVHGDIEDWPDYRPAPPPARPRGDIPVPRWLYVLNAVTIGMVCWILMDADLATGALLSLFLTPSIALLLHAGGIKVPPSQ